MQPAARVPAYLSPEVQAGLPPDRQADIYSMGVILYELVSGSLDQFGRQRAGERFSDVPPWLDELIERCTEKDLARRYRTTEEVSAALLKLKSRSAGVARSLAPAPLEARVQRVAKALAEHVVPEHRQRDRDARGRTRATRRRRCCPCRP